MNLIMWSAKLEAEVGSVRTSDFFRQFVSILPVISQRGRLFDGPCEEQQIISTHSGKKLSYKSVLRLI